MKRKRLDPIFVPHKIFCGPCHPQNWSFPDSVIYYITTNPLSPKGYQKLIKVCKYFFTKNPIIVISELTYHHKLSAKSENEEVIHSFKWQGKIWIIEWLFIHLIQNFKTDIVSTLIPKIYQCDVNKLYLVEQIITFNEFLHLSKNVEKIRLLRTIIKNQDGTVVSVEKIVEVLTKIKEFTCIIAATGSNVPNNCIAKFISEVRLSITSKTMKEIITIDRFSKCDNFVLDGVDDMFDIETFYTYMKENKHTKFRLAFDDTLSPGYKNRVEEIIDEIIATKRHEYKPPWIYFHGIDAEKRRNLNLLF